MYNIINILFVNNNFFRLFFLSFRILWFRITNGTGHMRVSFICGMSFLSGSSCVIQFEMYVRRISQPIPRRPPSPHVHFKRFYQTATGYVLTMLSKNDGRSNVPPPPLRLQEIDIYYYYYYFFFRHFFRLYFFINNKDVRNVVHLFYCLRIVWRVYDKKEKNIYIPTFFSYLIRIRWFVKCWHILSVFPCIGEKFVYWFSFVGIRFNDNIYLIGIIVCSRS